MSWLTLWVDVGLSLQRLDSHWLWWSSLNLGRTGAKDKLQQLQHHFNHHDHALARPTEHPTLQWLLKTAECLEAEYQWPYGKYAILVAES